VNTVLHFLLILWLLLFLIGAIMIVRIGSARTLDGVLSLLVPGYIVFAMIRYWGHPDHDVRYLMLTQTLIAAAVFWGLHSAEQPAQAMQNAPSSTAAQTVPNPVPSTAPAKPHAAATSSAPPAPATAAAGPAHPAAATVDPGTATPAAPQRASPAELRDIAASVTFFRGRFSRTGIGLKFDIPPRGYRMLDGNDARRVHTALEGADDTHLIGWVVGEYGVLTDPALRPVQLRWLGDGLVVASPGELDAAGLLKAANAQPHLPRLAGSDGRLVRFVSAPAQTDHLIVWSEERQAENSKKSAIDCHALRLARKGVLEFSMVGVDTATARTCIATLQEFAADAHFEPKYEYPTQTEGNFFAVYSLSGLIAQTQ
jgi:hypothetical protein